MFSASHHTIKVNAMVMVKRLLPSSLMYVIIQELRLYFISTSLIYKAMAFLVVSIVSKKSTITWQYSHLELKNAQAS
jgi:hypothetical protein